MFYFVKSKPGNGWQILYYVRGQYRQIVNSVLLDFSNYRVRDLVGEGMVSPTAKKNHDLSIFLYI